MTGQKPNPPHRHHYVPTFYLKRWAGSDGRLCEFSRPRDVVRPKRVFPQATGYQDRLYEIRGHLPELAQQVEQRFFRTVDDQASKALCLMEEQGNSLAWTTDTRSAWTRFILSLLHRCPEDLDLLRQTWSRRYEFVSDEVAQRYRAEKTGSDPESLEELLALTPLHQQEEGLFTAFMALIDNQRIGEVTNGLHWHIFELPSGVRSFMTSDRPVIRSNGLLVAGGHIAIPIGPRRLFIACLDFAIVQQIYGRSPGTLVRETNKLVAGAAAKYVYDANDSAILFVENWMSKQPQPRLLEQARAGIAVSLSRDGSQTTAAQSSTRLPIGSFSAVRRQGYILGHYRSHGKSLEGSVGGYFQTLGRCRTLAT